MIRSMTGYGKAEVALSDKKITAEVRSLNSKQLDMTVKLPGAYRQAEHEIRNRAARVLQRGKADVYISVESLGVSTAANINGELFGHYYGQLAEIGRKSGIAWSAEADASAMAAILRMPEVVQGEISAVGDEEMHALIDTVDKALERIDEFRIREGDVLIKDLLKRTGIIEELRKRVEPFEAERTEAVKTKIRESMASLDLTVNENRFEQEMIYYMEKLDITEEKIRLDNHCRYFREVAAEEEGAGRKLGFIAQEIGREINTMGSKANNAAIQRIVVQMKDELEKIKEQVLNIL